MRLFTGLLACIASGALTPPPDSARSAEISDEGEASLEIEATGFESFWSVEILSKAHRMLPLKEQAKRSFGSAMKLFR